VLAAASVDADLLVIDDANQPDGCGALDGHVLDAVSSSAACPVLVCIRNGNPGAVVAPLPNGHQPAGRRADAGAVR